MLLLVSAENLSESPRSIADFSMFSAQPRLILFAFSFLGVYFAVLRA